MSLGIKLVLETKVRAQIQIHISHHCHESNTISPVTAVQTLTVAPEAPGLWSLVPFFPADSGPAARPSVPSASCSPSPCSRAETHVGGPAPPGSPLQQILR